MTRPLIRKVGSWWRIYWGHTTYHSGDYYTNNTTAHDAAARRILKETSWR